MEDLNMANDQSFPVTRKFSEIEAKPISWLWDKQIAKGRITIISGDPGLGKSQITAYMASVVSNGGEWPIEKGTAPLGSVILLNAEDDPADTIRPRLEALEANLEKIRILTIKTGEIERFFRLDKDIEILEETLIEIEDVALVVIDPISAYLDKTDSYKDSEIRSLLSSLHKIAQEYDVAIVLISHLNKTSERRALHRVLGSVGLVAAARTAFVVTTDHNNPERRFFLPLKNNISEDKKGLSFSIQKTILDSGFESSESELSKDALFLG